MNTLVQHFKNPENLYHSALCFIMAIEHVVALYTTLQVQNIYIFNKYLCLIL